MSFRLVLQLHKARNAKSGTKKRIDNAYCPSVRFPPISDASSRNLPPCPNHPADAVHILQAEIGPVRISGIVRLDGDAASGRVQREPLNHQSLVGPQNVGQLKPGSVLLIEKNEPHQIINTGRRELRTVNFYAPPAYGKDGDVLPKVT